MNEFAFLADRTGVDDPQGVVDLTELACWLAATPCGPLFKRHVSPDRELRALVDDYRK